MIFIMNTLRSYMLRDWTILSEVRMIYVGRRACEREGAFTEFHLGRAGGVLPSVLES